MDLQEVKEHLIASINKLAAKLPIKNDEQMQRAFEFLRGVIRQAKNEEQVTAVANVLYSMTEVKEYYLDATNVFQAELEEIINR